MTLETTGVQMHDLLRELFPICRSITGMGVRQTLEIIGREVDGLVQIEIPSGTEVFDWVVPNEWNLNKAYLIDPNGRKLCDTNDNNLHLVGYSVPIKTKLSLDKLKPHLHTLPDRPDTIPYVTSYYKERWGFCLTHKEYESLVDGEYEVHIDTTLEPGHLTYGEVFLQGDSEKEIFFSTYVCHPSMANNELSGPVLTTTVIKWLKSLPTLNYSYRFVFIPETIGSITYLSRNLEKLQQNVLTGFNVTCVGDEGKFSYLPSRAGNGLADRAIKHTLKHMHPDYNSYSFLDRGSDERQYCAPGVDLPIASLMRSKFGEYSEYHTSDDGLDFVTPAGLESSLQAYRRVITVIENNHTYEVTKLCEPQMGKRGLYPTLGTPIKPVDVKRMMHILAYCDGGHDALEIADIIQCPAWELFSLFEILYDKGLLQRKAVPSI